MQIRKIRLEDYADLPNPGLLMYLNALQTGQPEIYRTPFFDKRPIKVIRDEWMRRLKSSTKLRVMPGLFEIEVEQAKKVGPYSVIPPARDRMKSVLSFWTEIADGKPILPEAIQATQELFQKGALNLWSLDAVSAEMRLNTNSGLPSFEKRRRFLDKLKRSGYRQEKPFMAVWGTRVQPGGLSVEDEKVRDVMMMPMLLNMLESQYYYPLIRYEQEKRLPFSVTTLRDTEEDVTMLFDTKGDNLVINTDFSKFDQHYNKVMQSASKDILKYAFSSAAQTHIDKTFDLKYEIPLLISKDKAIFGPRGMGSGSTGTNPDENLGHKALQNEVAIIHGKELNRYSRDLGDDGILSYPGITVADVVDAYTSHGLVMNPEKQYADKHSTYYLQRFYHDSYRDKSGIMLGVYSTERALGRLLSQERFYDPELWNATNVDLRALQILETCNNHPMFEEFIDFVESGDKYRLGKDIPQFADKLEENYERYKANFGVDSYTSQNEKTSILDWKVVQYLFG